MRQIFGVIWVGVGLVAFVQMLAGGAMGYELLGAFTGLVIFFLIPGYFLLRKKKKKEFYEGDKEDRG
ncbi:MAG: hypothetical protein LBT78_05360 [Tannerella sp.]|jgi:uncharacterized iron-regulated membrane protein|nr:hypothetical protein [Tannerella sp.]